MKVTKTELMARVVAGIAHECFEHTDEGIFDVTLMRLWAEKHGTLVTVALDEIVPWILKTRDTEPARVMELSRGSWEFDPGMFVEYEYKGIKEHLMIDGHHRALRRAAEGCTDMHMFLIPQSAIIRPQEGWFVDMTRDWGDKVIKDGKLVDRE